MDDQTALAWKADANGGDSIRQGSQRSHRAGKGGEAGRNGGAGADEKGGSAVSGFDRLRRSVAESRSVRGAGTTVPRVMAAAMLMEQKLEYGKLMLPNSRHTSAMADLRLQSRLRLGWAKARAEAHNYKHYKEASYPRASGAAIDLPPRSFPLTFRPICQLIIGFSACGVSKVDVHTSYAYSP